MGSVGSTARSYDSFDKTITDTLIVERNGRYQIEQYNDQNLDEYDHAAEMNHDKLLQNKYQENNGAFYMRGISINEIMDYLRKNYNLR